MSGAKADEPLWHPCENTFTRSWLRGDRHVAIGRQAERGVGVVTLSHGTRTRATDGMTLPVKLISFSLDWAGVSYSIFIGIFKTLTAVATFCQSARVGSV